ncbi:hypothetical protein [Streptomyces sp. NBC_01602]|uniref:hypothetical protein n=1 Tax=Streptomyces sp. NBC_01602 TaxID=2975893 RepID=UPI003867595A|nr:hypothetical protein OG955_06865 [Streptomyces sp. NBC_01602]
MSVYEVIKKLPCIAAVRDRSKALAMLDAVLCPEWDFRYFSFDSRWSQGEEMASMRDGSGNDYAIVFAAAGAYAQACNHESPMTPSHLSPPAPWPGLFDSVPEVFRSYVEEPAFADHNGLPRATVCLWREHSDSQWKCGNVDVPDEEMDDADGAEWLFDVLVGGSAEAYQTFAEDYYEVTLDLSAVQDIWDLKPLTQQGVSALNPKATLSGLAEDIAQIGYPTA